MAMSNRELQRQIDAFAEARKGWLEILERHPESVPAAQMILQINTKVDLLRSMWSWTEEDRGA